MPIPISDILNNESGASVRGKLNDALDYVNALPLKLWRGLLNQSSTNAPTAKVLTNTLGGTITWARSSAGQYTGTLSGVFTADKTFLLINSFHHPSIALDFKSYHLIRADSDTLSLVSWLNGVTLSDDLLIDTSVEIAIYP